MILHIYANFNNEGEFFGQEVFEHIDPDEMIENYAQIISGLPKVALERLKSCDLYCLGSFDNVSGQIVPEKTFLLHCGEVCSRYLKEDVKKEEVSA